MKWYTFQWSYVQEVPIANLLMNETSISSCSSPTHLLEHFMQILNSSPSAFEPIPRFKNTLKDSQFPESKKWKCAELTLTYKWKGLSREQCRDIITEAQKGRFLIATHVKPQHIPNLNHTGGKRHLTDSLRKTRGSCSTEKNRDTVWPSQVLWN